jgi:hypothetical protein
MNTTSTGEMTPDEVAEEVLANAPLKDSSSTYGYEAGEEACFAEYEAEKAKEKTEEKKAENRREQTLAKLRSKTLSSDSFMNLASGRWHIKDMFYVGQVGVMVGMWKAGKTFTALHLSFRIAWGLPLSQPRTEFGKPAKPVGEVRLKGNVLYIPAEGAGGLKDRIKAYRQYYKSEKTDAGDVLVYPESFNVFNPADLLALSDYCTEQQIVFIVVDTLASNLAGLIRAGHSNPENDSGAMSMMFDNLTRVCEAQKHGCSALFLHHPSKPSGGGSTTDARGSGGIEASARFKLKITAKEDGNRTLALGFNNDADDSKAPVIPFRLESVNIGVTEDGDPKEVAVFQCGGVKANDGRPAELLFAFSKMMDENQEADRLDFQASVKTLYPEWKDNTFRFYLSKAVKSGYLELLTKKAGRNQRYRLTELGLSNVPEVKSDV